jgi:hypothetical protein
MSSAINRARDELVRTKILRNLDQRHRDMTDAMAEAIRHGTPLPSHIDPAKPLPDVPLHKRGFGVMDEDAP